MKRMLDLTASLIGLSLFAPLIGIVALSIWIEDRGSPWYRGTRVAMRGSTFRMLKFRSMRVDAWQTGVNSTSADDGRITRTGRWLRRIKLDELPQLWNVLLGQMSLVGPRPQVPTDAALYTTEERQILDARPGMTDVASIVFADEGEILAGATDPDLLYNQIIRPWKSRLALIYVQRASVATDVKIVALTLLALASRPTALKSLQALLTLWDAPPLLRRMASRSEPLLAYPPPGAKDVVRSYRATSA